MSIRFLHFTDPHCPIHSQRAINWLYGQISDFDPHLIVCGGDSYDGNAWSRWDNENLWSPMDEYEAWAKIVHTINGISPNSKKVWLYGNHEANLMEPGRLKKDLRAMVDWRDWDPADRVGLRDKVREWRVVTRYGSTVRWNCGPVTFTHGTKCNLYAARDEALMHGSAFGLVLSGHTHRPEAVTRHRNAGNIPGDLWYANSGCLMDWEKARYVHRMNYQSWGHAVTVGEIYTKDKAALHEGRKSYSSKIWDAEVRVLGIARDA